MGWFASHPRTLDRVERAVAEAEEAMAREGRVGREAYLERVEGIIYGEDPAQGFVRGRTFVHPELRFAFEAPRGFRLINTPQAVLGQGPGGQIMVFDAAAVSPTQSLRAYLARGWTGRAPVTNIKTFQVDGMEAVGGLAPVQVNGRRIEALLVAIRYDGDRVYRFVFADPRGGLDLQDVRLWDATVDSFRRLGAREAAEFRPHRIEVVTVRPGETVEDLARRMAVDELAREQFLVLNNLQPGEELEPGQRVKLVVEG